MKMQMPDHRMPKELLFALFNCAFGTSSGQPRHWQPPPPPQISDIKCIESTLRVRLPLLLVELASEARYFTRWFAGLGPDRASEHHILSTNEWLANEGKPEELIVLTHAYDGDCVGILRGEDLNPNATPIVIVSINLWGDRNPSKPREVAPNFHSYLQDLCLDMAPHSRIKSLRRKAKRLIEEWKKENA